jgi:glutathione S-transferase
MERENSMSEVVIYGILGSPFLRAAQMGVEEKQAPYRIEPIPPGAHKSPDHLARHPFGRSPVIEHGDFRLYETQAILRYLDAIFPDPPLQPAEPQAIGRMNQIIGINDWYLFQKVGAVIVFNRIVGPRLMGLKPDEAAIEAAMPMARTCINELGRLLADNAFLAGDRLSIADLMVAPQLDFLQATPEGRDLLVGTALATWLARMNERPSMQRTQRPGPLRAA